jgi:hypothetical protein
LYLPIKLKVLLDNNGILVNETEGEKWETLPHLGEASKEDSFYQQ